MTPISQKVQAPLAYCLALREEVLMKILLADDHDLVRDTIAVYLTSGGDMGVTQAKSFHEAREILEERAPFDVVLLDYEMPGMQGIETLKEAIALNKGKPVAILSGTADKSVAEAAMELGGAGFLPKSMPASSLINAIKFMAMGEKYAPLDFMTAEDKSEIHPLRQTLTDREFEVLDGLCRGLANKEIARELDLQEVTVKLHVKTLCKKLDAKNRTHAAVIAKEAGLF